MSQARRRIPVHFLGTPERLRQSIIIFDKHSRQ